MLRSPNFLDTPAQIHGPNQAQTLCTASVGVAQRATEIKTSMSPVLKNEQVSHFITQ